jgi:hypothetical protein
MYGVDYPHPEGSWKRTLPWFQAVLHDTDSTDEEIRLMAGGNAVRVYGIDVDELAPIADRIGFTLDEVRQPVPDDIDPALVNAGGLKLA